MNYHIYLFQMELKDNCISYIDVTHGSCEAYIRCDTTETAQAFVQKNFEGKRLIILEGKKITLFCNYNIFILSIHIHLVSIFFR